jgi:peptidoglycan/LPS O-acetylase OafA/YrhL
MELAQQFAIVSAMGFFFMGLLGGVWKYAKIRRSPEGQAPAYVDIFHRSTLLYAFACLLIERMVALSQLPAWLEGVALTALIGFFLFAVFGYALHGWLEDTDNQLRRPYRLGRSSLPPSLVHGSMAALVVAEVGGFAILAVGVLMAL